MKPVSARIHTTLVDYWPLLLVIITGLSLGGNLWQLHSYYHAPAFHYENVRFISPIAGTNGYGWMLEMDDEKGPFRMIFCSDYDVPSLNAQPGEVVKFIDYQDMGGCGSLKAKDMGWRFYTDKNNWTIETDLNRDFKSVLKEIKNGEWTR